MPNMVLMAGMRAATKKRPERSRTFNKNQRSLGPPGTRVVRNDKNTFAGYQNYLKEKEAQQSQMRSYKNDALVNKFQNLEEEKEDEFDREIMEQIR